jgi:hypothetical protein
MEIPKMYTSVLPELFYILHWRGLSSLFVISSVASYNRYALSLYLKQVSHIIEYLTVFTQNLSLGTILHFCIAVYFQSEY